MASHLRVIGWTCVSFAKAVASTLQPGGSFNIQDIPKPNLYIKESSVYDDTFMAVTVFQNLRENGNQTSMIYV